MIIIRNIWNELRQESPECYQFIIGLARKNYDTGREESEEITESTKPLVEIALNRGLLATEGDQTFFPNVITKCEAIIQFVTEELLDPVWDDPSLLGDTILNVSRSTRQYKEDIIGSALVTLHNEYNRNIIDRISIEADGGDHFWTLYDPFIKALPHLLTSPRSLKHALVLIRKATDRDLTGGMVFTAMESLSQNQSDLANELLNLLISESDDISAVLIAPTLSGLSKIDFKKAHRRSIELSQSKKTELAQSGIIALSIITYDDGDRQSELNETLERYAQLDKTTSESKASALATGYGNLIEAGVDVGEKLVRLSRRQQPKVQASIATVLFRRLDDFSDETWFRDALLNLKTTKPEYKGIIHEIDMTLYGLLKKETDLVFQFLEAWITNHDYGHGTEENELPSVMNSTIHRLCDYSGALEKWITRWFNSNDRRLHQAAADLSAEYCRERPNGTKRQINLSQEVLNKCSEDDVIFILQKVLGNVILQGEVQSSLIFSILRREPCSEALQREIYYAFIKYIAYNFPGSALEYLREKSTSGSDIEKEIATKIIKRMDQYYDALQNLPRLKELDPPESRLNMYMKMRMKESARISELANEKSVLLKLVTKIPLKAGKSFFHKLGGQYSEKTDLGRISTSFEIPRGEYIDPVGQAILRFNWRTLTRKTGK